MSKLLKKNNAITLIALVITIIILIILAGISIAILGGEDGLIEKTKEAGGKQKIAEVEEKINLELVNAETDAILRGEQLEVAQRNDIASKYGTVNGDILTTTDGGYEIDLKKIYDKTLSESGSYTAQKQLIEKLQNDLATAEANLQAAQMSQSEAGATLAELQTTIASMTATPADVLSSKTIYDKTDGTVKSGTKTYDATYTYPANSTGATYELGVNNNYRYVNAANVYAKGKADGAAATKTVNIGLSSSSGKWGEVDIYVNGTKRWSNQPIDGSEYWTTHPYATYSVSV